MKIKTSKKLNKLASSICEDDVKCDLIMQKADAIVWHYESTGCENFEYGSRITAKAEKLNKPLYKILTGNDDFSLYFIKELKEITTLMNKVLKNK